MPSTHELGVEGKNQNFSLKEDSSQSPKHKVVACNSVQKKLACDVFLPIKSGGGANHPSTVESNMNFLKTHQLIKQD